VLSGPRLLDGDYFLTMHFGDSRTDFEYHTHCLKMTVTGMVKTRVNCYPETYGFIYPDCERYEFMTPS